MKKQTITRQFNGIFPITFLKKYVAGSLLVFAFLLPVNGYANNEAHGIFGLGLQIGIVEHGASINTDPAFLVKALRYARDHALASGCVPTAEIDNLITAMQVTTSSKSLYPRITAYRQQLATYVLENCGCAGKGVRNQPISSYKTSDYQNSSTDYAKVSKDLLFDVGLGSHPKWGFGYASVEMSGKRKVSVDVHNVPSVYAHYDQNSFAGFVIDYHTTSGYTHRVMLGVGMLDRKRNHHDFIAGAAPRHVQYIDLGKKSRYFLDFGQWAPTGWDGKIWFSVGIQNAGENNSIRAKLNL